MAATNEHMANTKLEAPCPCRARIRPQYDKPRSGLACRSPLPPLVGAAPSCGGVPQLASAAPGAMSERGHYVKQFRIFNKSSLASPSRNTAAAWESG
jgi:hypothetical protein